MRSVVVTSGWLKSILTDPIVDHQDTRLVQRKDPVMVELECPWDPIDTCQLTLSHDSAGLET